MSLDHRLFVGHPRVLARFGVAVPTMILHVLTAGAELAVWSLTDELQDALHRANGTGEWLDYGPSLTTTDMTFAARASETGPLAFVQMARSDDSDHQSAALWIGGGLALKPTDLAIDRAGNRPRATWPVNAALRGVGVTAITGRDEAQTFGLDLYDNHASVMAKALRLKL